MCVQVAAMSAQLTTMGITPHKRPQAQQAPAQTPAQTPTQTSTHDGTQYAFSSTPTVHENGVWIDPSQSAPAPGVYESALQSAHEEYENQSAENGGDSTWMNTQSEELPVYENGAWTVPHQHALNI